MTQIIDIIQHKNRYNTQTLVVVNELPSFKYEKINDLLIAEDSGFFHFYKFDRPSEHFRAFAGRKFDIPLKSGGVEKAHGQWWDHFPSDYGCLVYSVGVSTVSRLENCYVFCSMKVDRQRIDDWLSKNEPSNNYHKYDKKSKDYGKQIIVSRWELA